MFDNKKRLKTRRFLLRFWVNNLFKIVVVLLITKRLFY